MNKHVLCQQLRHELLPQDCDAIWISPHFFFHVKKPLSCITQQTTAHRSPCWPDNFIAPYGVYKPILQQHAELTVNYWWLKYWCSCNWTTKELWRTTLKSIKVGRLASLIQCLSPCSWDMMLSNVQNSRVLIMKLTFWIENITWSL